MPIEKYIYAPRVVEAVRWYPDAKIPHVYTIKVGDRYQGHIIDENGKPHYIIPGMWIVRTPGSLYWRPYTDTDFTSTFSQVDNGNPVDSAK